MGAETKIQWCDASWNPWHGCIKVSPGCMYCYMYRDKEKYGQDPTEVARSKTKFYDPLQFIKTKHIKRVFTCSWSDFFIEQADQWRGEAWRIIRDTPQLTYQILTKRPENIIGRLPPDWGTNGYPNVWLGVSVESQSYTDRVVQLAMLKPKNAKFKTFISAEPLIAFTEYLAEELTSKAFERMDWMIIGGESGNENGKWKYRPCNPDWIRHLMEQARVAKVPIFIKQLGTYLAKKHQLTDRHGGQLDEWPHEFKIREFPEI